MYSDNKFSELSLSVTIAVGNAQRRVLGPKPIPFVGNFGRVIFLKESVTKFSNRLYNAYPDEKVVGIYQGMKPWLLVRDPELIKNVLIKNFSHFADRGTKLNNNQLSFNLFDVEGDAWRTLRQSFTPIFSSGKIKSMSPLIVRCVKDFQEYVGGLIEKEVGHEVRSLMARYTLEVIGTCAFGLSVGTLSEENNQFRDIASTMFTPRLKVAIWRGLDTIFPGIMDSLGIRITNAKVYNFFMTLTEKMLQERRGKPKVRKDFMDLLIEMYEQGRIKLNKKDETSSELEITKNVMAAQAMVFYAAGFETSSAAMSFLLHELALDEECQERIYNEIREVTRKYGDQICYEAVCEMNYLEMALDETMRKHPPGGVLIRKCVSDYVCPITKLKIEKDMRILIPVMALHRDKKYFSNPDEFNPERFAPENKMKIPSCVYIPFGEGPRNCIGLRFAKIESMMGIAGFLMKFKVEPSAKTKKQLDYDNKGITLKSRDGIWLIITKREV
ncbi:Cytochrome P450 6B2 [Eumeta japonica]|uniref:unspecific monooxygenase n=1 Tax=Eumeta variegata TaxID=151549 RepID=A0A4C1V4G6_EUMVA|nr:Cytochrome P450 6B2 [Eumeta japonica]